MVKVANKQAGVWTDKMVDNVAVKVKPFKDNIAQIEASNVKRNGQISFKVRIGDDERWTHPVELRNVSGVGLGDYAMCRSYGPHRHTHIHYVYVCVCSSCVFLRVLLSLSMCAFGTLSL